jgi:stage V sporulation protein G
LQFCGNPEGIFNHLVEYLLNAVIDKGSEHKMEVTDVRLRRVNTDGRMKAIASITIDHEFVVHDIRVIDGNNGMFVAMPSKRTPDGEFRDIAHPISSATREKIQAAVLAEYERVGLEEEDRIEAGA